MLLCIQKVRVRNRASMLVRISFRHKKDCCLVLKVIILGPQWAFLFYQAKWLKH